MNVQTKRWARPLALFIALTMIMMYSFGGVVFAVIGDVKVHYKGESNGTIFVITTVPDKGTFTASAIYTGNGINYVGKYSDGFPLIKGDKLNANGVVTVAYTFVNEVKVDLTVDQSSAVGNQSAVIRIADNDPKYDLSVEKKVDTTNASINSQVTFTIVVKNIGDVDAEDITVTDNLPSGLTYSSSNASKGDYTGGVWTIGYLDSGKTATLTIIAIANAAVSFTNVASINISDDNNSNNTSSASGIVYDPQNPVRDLQITKTVDDNDVTIGKEVTFTIEAKNIGDTAMSGVEVTDSVPAGLSVSAVSFTTGTTFSGITWEVGSLNAGESKYLTIAAVTTTTGSITNTATGTAIGDNTPNNNFDSDTVQVNPKTQSPDPVKDLEITKTVNQASQASVTVGTGVTFTITVTNIGHTTMEAVEVKETWDTGLTQGTVNAAEGTTFSGTTWEVGTLGPDESRTLTIAAGTPTAGTYTNNVEIVFGEVADGNLTNNTAAAIVTVTNPGTTGDDDDDVTPTGTTTTITPTPTPLTDIPETETPTVEAPEATLEDQPIPLADVPQTGDNANIWLLLALMMGSGAGIVLLGRRKETVEK